MKRPSDAWHSIVPCLRLDAADTVVILDAPRLTRLRRVMRRRVTYRDRTRPSLPRNCLERFTVAFLDWIWTHRERRGGPILAMLERLPGAEIAPVPGGRENRDRSPRAGDPEVLTRNSRASVNQ